jgi:hypothetical protein
MRSDGLAGGAQYFGGTVNWRFTTEDAYTKLE